jgi:hypothetical protein
MKATGWLLPAGAVAGWDLHPLESAAFPRRTPNADRLALVAREPSCAGEALADRIDRQRSGLDDAEGGVLTLYVIRESALVFP